ncbi:hypothetical protein OCU04_002752 [Sclerotinia nivalis]|uniref:Uncharacterized protein n=1 Tax=Sclerotinia nivalis TaxID=352851 RepID=A0A9X0DQI3_9HELO|nr:hypothetical protein OCU04_002752 [Sclerotinia nivalis]
MIQMRGNPRQLSPVLREKAKKKKKKGKMAWPQKAITSSMFQSKTCRNAWTTAFAASINKMTRSLGTESTTVSPGVSDIQNTHPDSFLPNEDIRVLSCSGGSIVFLGFE